MKIESGSLLVTVAGCHFGKVTFPFQNDTELIFQYLCRLGESLVPFPVQLTGRWLTTSCPWRPQGANGKGEDQAGHGGRPGSGRRALPPLRCQRPRSPVTIPGRRVDSIAASAPAAAGAKWRSRGSPPRPRTSLPSSTEPRWRPGGPAPGNGERARGTRQLTGVGNLDGSEGGRRAREGGTRQLARSRGPDLRSALAGGARAARRRTEAGGGESGAEGASF